MTGRRGKQKDFFDSFALALTSELSPRLSFAPDSILARKWLSASEQRWCHAVEAGLALLRPGLAELQDESRCSFAS